MLVLTRRDCESIDLRDIITGETITVKVLEIRGSSVRIGVEASSEWNIKRSEIEWEDTGTENCNGEGDS